MKKTKIFLPLLVMALILSSCTKENLTPNYEEVSTEKTLPLANETDELFFELADQYLLDETAIIQALGVDQVAESRAATNPFVYTMSNETAGNQVIAYKSKSDGTLSELGKYATYGTGTGGGLGNQGAIALSYLQNFLYVVNAGSNEISFFIVCKDGRLKFVNKVASGGTRPVSITTYRSLIYVVNAGSDNITGFTHNTKGKLVALDKSTQSLSGAGTGAAQISFSTNGRALVVTEKATNNITSYVVNAHGRPGMGQSFSSAGMTPFGFTFVRSNRFYVSEAAGGAAGASTVSSYEVDAQGKVSLISGPFATKATAACWVAVSNDPRTIYVTNTGSNDISSLNAKYSGALSFANNGKTTTTGGGPIDAITDSRSKYLYVLSSGADAIYSYKIGKNGALTQIDTDGGLPDGTNGLALKDH